MENKATPQTKKPKTEVFSKEWDSSGNPRYSQFDVDIHGKKYRTVAGRITEFWDLAKEQKIKASIETQIEYMDKEIRVVAIVKLGDSYAYGHASEIIGSSLINKDSALENAETSAVGRALGNLGIGLVGAGGIASAEEVGRAVDKQAARPATGQPIIKASEAQKKFIESLVNQLGWDMSWFEKNAGKKLADITKTEASAQIKDLQIKIEKQRVDSGVPAEADSPIIPEDDEQYGTP